MDPGGPHQKPLATTGPLDVPLRADQPHSELNQRTCLGCKNLGCNKEAIYAACEPRHCARPNTLALLLHSCSRPKRNEAVTPSAVAGADAGVLQSAAGVAPSPASQRLGMPLGLEGASTVLPHVPDTARPARRGGSEGTSEKGSSGLGRSVTPGPFCVLPKTPSLTFVTFTHGLFKASTER